MCAKKLSRVSTQVTVRLIWCFPIAVRYTLVDILRAILLSLEAMIEDPELQVNGFVLIIDWSNFTFKQASKLTPSMLRLAIEGLQVRIRLSPLLGFPGLPFFVWWVGIQNGLWSNKSNIHAALEHKH